LGSDRRDPRTHQGWDQQDHLRHAGCRNDLCEGLGDDPAWPEASPSSGMGSRAEQQAATSVEQDAADAAHQRSQAEASPYQEGVRRDAHTLYV
ncbi:hypothetical protein DK320_15045, partial [Listeria monocytogenes]